MKRKYKLMFTLLIIFSIFFAQVILKTYVASISARDFEDNLTFYPAARNNYYGKLFFVIPLVFESNTPIECKTVLLVKGYPEKFTFKGKQNSRIKEDYEGLHMLVEDYTCF